MAEGTAHLDYAHPGAVRRGPKRFFHIALICGLGPLAIGTTVFLLWIITEAEPLAYAGIVTILLGLCLFPLGVGLLVAYTRMERRARCQERRRLMYKVALAGTVLLGNIPIAAAYVMIAANIMTRYSITVINEGAVTVDSFVLSKSSLKVELGPIPPGKRVKHAVSGMNGNLAFTATVAGKTTTGVAVRDMDDCMGGRATVTIKPEGYFALTQTAR